MNIGFDEILHNPVVSTDNIGISPSGQHVVSSSLYMDTFSEHPAKNREKPVKIINGSSDTIGFFGENVYMVAIASGDVLRIIDYHNLVNIATMIIRPGSLFVPDSASSPFIGAISPKGNCVIIDENANVIKTSLYVKKGHNVLWTSTARPVGYIWNDEDGKANLYIRSTSHDKGSVVSSSSGISVFCVWANPETKQHEAYFSVENKPHILKKVTSSDDGAIVEDICEFPVGSEINQVLKLPNGQPVVVSAMFKSRMDTQYIGDETSVSKLISDVISDETRLTYMKMVGNSSYVSWTQTPVTKPVPAVTMYANEGRPRYEIKGNAIDIKPLRPVTNVVMDFEVSSDYMLSYRVVSPYSADGKYTAEKMVVITDEFGYDAAGSFSPTVRMLYELGIPVAIVPMYFTGEKNVKVDIANFIPDIIDVTRHVVEKNLCLSTIVIGNDAMCSPVIEAMKKKNAKVSKCILVNPHNKISAQINHKRIKNRVVSAYFGVDEEVIDNPGEYKFFDIENLTDKEIEREVSLFLEEIVL